MATGIGSSTDVTQNWINESFPNDRKEQKMHRFLPNKITQSLMYVNRSCLHAQSTIKDPSSATTMSAKQKHPAEADRKRLFFYEFAQGCMKACTNFMAVHFIFVIFFLLVVCE